MPAAGTVLCDSGRAGLPRVAASSAAKIREFRSGVGTFPATTCFGCGPANPRGLRLKSYLGDGCVTATFMPWPEHDNGMGFLNGGIIATVLDCHTAAGVLNEASLQGWEADPGAVIPSVTASIDVRYLRPSPLDTAVELRAFVIKSSEAEIVCDAELRYDDQVRATGHAVWNRWRTR